MRLAGLYALEHLAHSNVEYRQTIVDVICACLRMPYTAPRSSASVSRGLYCSPGHARRRRARAFTGQPPHTMPMSPELRQEHAEQQWQVRLTAQDILSRKLRFGDQRRRCGIANYHPPSGGFPNHHPPIGPTSD